VGDPSPISIISRDAQAVAKVSSFRNASELELRKIFFINTRQLVIAEHATKLQLVLAEQWHFLFKTKHVRI
jgi:hypothetical protein